MRLPLTTALALCFLSPLACSSKSAGVDSGDTGSADKAKGAGGNTAGTGGSASTGGSSPGAGGQSSSGATSGSGGDPGSTGGVMNAGSGASSAGGSTADGGAGTGGTGDDGETASGGGDGSGGETASGGSDGTGGDDGGRADVSPSAGCGSGTSVNVSNAIVGLPDGYDGSTPVPVLFAFHAANNPSSQLESRFGNTVLGEKYLMIYLAAQDGGGWTIRNDKGRFNSAFDEVMSGACVDENRIYAIGHSSGAQFIAQLLCDGEDRFDAVVPIASSVYCSSWDPVATLNIHGLSDEEREAYGLNDGDGAKDIVPYTSSNSCSSTTIPSVFASEGCGGSITPGCVDFEGCSEATTWCNHNDPQYGTSNHGIPCFAESVISDFLGAL